MQGLGGDLLLLGCPALDQLPTFVGPAWFWVLGKWGDSRPVSDLELSSPTGRQGWGMSHSWCMRQGLALQSKSSCSSLIWAGDIRGGGGGLSEERRGGGRGPGGGGGGGL